MYRQSLRAAIVVMTVLTAFFAWSLQRSHDMHALEANNALLNHTLNLERQLQARLQSCDLILQAGVLMFKRAAPANPEQAESFSVKLQSLASVLPPGSQVRAANVDGDVVYGQNVTVAGKLSVAQRRYFQDAKADEGFVIGLPLLSRVTKNWVLPVARRLQDERGAFAGVVYANIELDDLAGSMRGLRLGDRGFASVFNARGEVLLRSDDQSARQDETPLRMISPATRALLLKREEAMVYGFRGGTDRIARLAMFRKIGDYPLYVGVALDRKDAFAGWYAEVRDAVIVWLLLGLTTVFFVLKQRQAASLLQGILTDLQKARLQADRASEFKSAWLANMSHEIRTPMNGVLGLAQLGARLPPGAPHAGSLFARIVDAGRLLQVILDDVLDMSKIEAGKLLLHVEATAVRNVAQRAMDLVSEAAAAKGLAMRFHAADDVPALIQVDPVRLQQILLNLLSNAVKFTDRGHVELAMELHDDSLVCSVRDSGIGLAKEALERLFVPFEQGSPDVAQRRGGTGLGLAITKRLVQMMGGAIEAASELQVGSTFVVRLPLMRAHVEERTDTYASEPPVPTQPPAGRLSGLHVLVAEDDEVNQVVISGMLQLEGATVEMVQSGHDALERARSSVEPFDAVLLDITMPGIDGFETARRLRTISPCTPIIGHTAHAMEEDWLRCQEAGMVDRVTKPVVLEELVRTLLNHTRARAGNGPR